jgi:hypothetical protein
MKNLLNLEWKFSKLILLISIFIALIIPIACIGWIAFELNIPFINGSDRSIAQIILFFWWCASMTLIFGWKVKHV